MIYFITDREHHIHEPDIQILKTTDLKILHDYLKVIPSICFDKEFNGLNPLYSIPLLTAIGDADNQFILDDFCFEDLSFLNPYSEKEHIGHNIKIDLSVASLQGYSFQTVWDTMIVEQRLGLDSKRDNTLQGTYLRRTGKVLPEDKAIREDFLKMRKGAIFQAKHIRYAASDIKILPEIVEVQFKYIDKWNMWFLIREIEFPLIPILVKMELEGINLDEERWKKKIEENKQKLFKIERELDEELRKLGFKIRQRNKVEVEQLGLFGENTSTVNKNMRHINYGSSPQVINKVFMSMGEIPPTLTSKTKDSKTGIKTYTEGNSISEDAINAYLLEYPRSKLKPFMVKLLEYAKVAKEINSFGEKFIKPFVVNKQKKRQYGYKNQRTGRVHTVFKQCMTATGRLSSGDAKIGLFNCQQLPAVKSYREPFKLSDEEIADDWWITTCDLTGAETVIMCAFAKDEVLLEWAVKNDDLHSPMATKCWRAVYDYRVRTGKDLTIRSTSYNKSTNKVDITQLSADIIIGKKENVTFRTDFKAVTFGVVYGAEAKTIGKTLNITQTEAQIIIDVIRTTIPKTFAMVEEAANMALRNARVVHNTRTNSHKWFVSAFKGFSIMEKGEKSSVSTEARNCRIQGTQADMVKEAMIEIDRFYTMNGIPNCPIFQIHDELVWKHKGKENGQAIAMIMGEVATRYLEGFTEMSAEYETAHNWTK